MMADTSIYQTRQPTFSQGLSSLANSLRENAKIMQERKLAELAIKQKQLDLENKERERQKEEDFLADYQTLEMEDSLTPENLQSLYAKYNPAGYAEMQMKQSDPSVKLREESNVLRRKELALKEIAEKRRSEQSKWKVEQDKIKNQMSNKRYDLSLQKYYSDLSMKQDQMDWEQSAPQRKQLELARRLSPIIQGYKKENQDLSVEGVKKINEGTASVGSLLSLTSALSKNVDKYGLNKLPGAKRSQMESQVLAIANSLNSPMFVNSGVLSPTELDNLKMMVGDPTDWFNLTKSQVKARMKELNNFIESKYVNRLEAYGLKGRPAFNSIKLKTKDYFKPFEVSDLTVEDEALIK